VAVLATPLLVLGACAGCSYPADRPDRFAPEPNPAQRVAEAIVWCKRAGFPVVRLEVETTKTHIRCGSLDTVVMVKGER
jgi:hypothetical protein